jgi:hypothetical protein
MIRAAPNRLRARTLGALAAALAPLLLGGCATIFTGTSDQLTFASNVPGVRLWIDGEYKGELPLTVHMRRHFLGGQQFVAKFERAGFQTQEFKLHRSFNAVAILDVTSVVTSGGIDLLTGALMQFDPTSYHVQMLPMGAKHDAGFERALRAWEVALATWRSVQKDLARGGGEHLAALAHELGDGDPAASARIEEAALRGREALVSARSAHAFVASLDEALASRPDVVAYRVNR